MKEKKEFIFPTLSVVISTWNVERTLPRLLKGFENQDYPTNRIEFIIVDGASTDRTLEILKKSKLKIRVIQGKYPKDPEKCKGQGLSYSKAEIVLFLDSDNYLPNRNWLKKMISPLLENRDLVGSYAWRFGYNKSDNSLNRYFSLIGSADTVGLYLGKADKLSYISDKWIGFGKLIKETKDYFIVQFNENNFPTLGSNGFFARREYILKGKADMEHFFHIDVPFDILKYGLDKYAVVKDVVIHDTAVDLLTFVQKRAKYMKLHYQKRSHERRYKVFDPDRTKDVLRLIVFILCSCTFIQPLYVSVKGYMKIKDPAWFLHPIFCFSMVVTYAFAISTKFFENLTKHD